jgi:DNA-binding winged helix-turn-helix (wHTH) protein/tetratricopeptide (TPR) repeat protein
MSSTILRYEFENYVLLPSERLLFQNTQPIPLKSKVFETLLTLVEHHGQLLTKEVLMQRIWGESFVEEGNLTQNIFTLRKIFDEKPRDHRFIVTVPNQGYRFVAKVREIRETDAVEPFAENGSSKNGHAKSLAVLPLKFLVPQEAKDNEHLGLAIADTLITRLSASRKFSVRPTEIVLKYAATERDAISIGRELAVDCVLSGTIQTSEKKIRANLRMLDTKTGETLWADRIEAGSNDFFELQDQISEHAANALTAENNRPKTAPKLPDNPELYQAYLKYRFFWETRTEEGLLTSLKGARQIVEAEPRFPLGHIGIADSFLLLGHHLYLAPGEVYAAVRAAVDKALELDPFLAEGYATKADYYFITKSWEEAERLHQISIGLKPDYASSRHWYSWFLTAMGRFEEALTQIEQAQQLDTNSLYLSTIRGVPLFYQKQFDRAVSQFNLVLEVEPGYNRARYYLALALFHSGQWEAGIAEFEKVFAAQPIQQVTALLGFCYGVAGMHAKAREMLSRLDRIAKNRYVSPYIRAYVYAGLGERENALAALEKAFDENAIWLIWLNVDMQFQSLRSEPRFKSLLEKLNFPK